MALRRFIGDAANDETGCDLRYQGQLYDAESGLYYNRHRYYDPDIGQYISPDPIGLAGGLRPQGYVHNPVEWCDPFGLNPDKCPNSVNKKNSAGVEVERRYVNDQDELLGEAEKAAGGNLDDFDNYKENWYQSPDGSRRIEWNPNGHANTNEGPHVTVRDFDGKRHSVTEKIFINGRDGYDGKF